MFDSQFTKDAHEYFRDKLDNNMKDRVKTAVSHIENNPYRGPNIKKLVNRENEYRYRIGDYRVVYHVDKTKRMCTILSILPRGRVY